MMTTNDQFSAEHQQQQCTERQAKIEKQCFLIRRSVTAGPKRITDAANVVDATTQIVSDVAIQSNINQNNNNAMIVLL